MKHHPVRERIFHVLAVVLPLSLAIIALAADETGASPRPVKHQITGLFSKDREQDLREAFAKVPGIKLVSIDFPNAEASLEYVPARVFPNAKPEQIVQRLDNLLKAASNHTFGVKPLLTTPREKLERIVIPVAGLDCKGCCLATYEAIYRLDGVETATASFREGCVTALINPHKTGRAQLEAALKKRGVDVKVP